jgi:lipopolysaccharide transport system permease protein
MATREHKWDWEIGPATSDWSWNAKDLFTYRHLLSSLIKREFLLNYQQTILGPLWVVFQPILTLITYVIVFQKLIGVSTGTLPPVLFYFSGIVLWNFFIESFDRTSNTYREHTHLFSKIYFPRIIMPLSLISTNFLRCMIQLVFLILIIAYYAIFKGFSIHFNYLRLAFPFAILCIGMISLGMGLVFSLLTAKYRDIANLVSISTRLLMFVTPIFYPLAAVREDFRWIVEINPLTPLFELFRLGLLGEGTVVFSQLIYSMLFMIVIFITGLLLFNKKGNKLIDVI